MEGYFPPQGGLPSPHASREPVLIVGFSYHQEGSRDSGALASRFRNFEAAFNLRKTADDLPGVAHYESTAPHMQGLDLYLSQNDRDDFLMYCDSPEKTLPPLKSPPFPSCTYSSRDDGYTLTVGFDRQYLQIWPEIVRKTRELLHSFETN